MKIKQCKNYIQLLTVWSVHLNYNGNHNQHRLLKTQIHSLYTLDDGSSDLEHVVGFRKSIVILTDLLLFQL